MYWKYWFTCLYFGFGSFSVSLCGNGGLGSLPDQVNLQMFLNFFFFFYFLC